MMGPSYWKQNVPHWLRSLLPLEPGPLPPQRPVGATVWPGRATHEKGGHGVAKRRPAEALAPSSLPRLQASPRAWGDVRAEEGFAERRGDGEGLCSPLSVAVPAGPVAVAPGGTALLPAALHLPAPPPPFFQVRWRFLPTGHLVLLLAAQGCGGAAPWRESCRLGLERGRGYEHRAGLGPHEASLLLQGARPEDAGTYRVSLLGLDVQVSAELNLTLAPTHTPTPAPAADPTSPPAPTPAVPTNSSSEQQEGTEPPLALVRAAEDGGRVVVSNAVRLGLAGLVLCLLVLIVGEDILSARNKDTPETDSPPDTAATNATLSTIYVLQEMPVPDGSEELYSVLSY